MILEIRSLIYTSECIFIWKFFRVFIWLFISLDRHTDIRYWTHVLFWKINFLNFRNLISSFILRWFVWFTTLYFNKMFFLWWLRARRRLAKFSCQKFFFNDLYWFFFTTLFETLFISPVLLFNRTFKLLNFFNFENILMNINLQFCGRLALTIISDWTSF